MTNFLVSLPHQHSTSVSLETSPETFMNLSAIVGNLSTIVGVQRWRSGESTRLPPMWPGFDSQIRRQVWAEFVGSPLCTERFSPGTPVSPLFKNQNLT